MCLIASEIKRRGSGERIICAIGISSYRYVEIPPKCTIDDFIEEISSIYDNAKETGYDSIVLVIDADTEQVCYINDTGITRHCLTIRLLESL